MAANLEQAGQWAQASGAAAQDYPTGALYVVATPIGNAADITLRALWVLSLVDAIAAEDTRVTRQLLDRFGIVDKQWLAAHEHNEHEAAQRIVELLQAGRRVALVTDAGTPALSDPGARIVAAVRAAGSRVIPLPGASSLLAALSAAGLAQATAFTFLGFLPTGATERRRVLAAALATGQALALLEAPHRIAGTLHELHQQLQAQQRVVIARELTKKFESIEAITAAELPAYLERQPARGEYVVLVEGQAPTAQLDADTRRWLTALGEALPAAKAAALAAKVTGLPRESLYRELTRRPEGKD